MGGGEHLGEVGLQQQVEQDLVDTVVASFDVDSLIDYRSRRPVITFDANRYTDYSDPSLLLYHLLDRDGQTYYILTGPEPDYQWERVSEAVRILAASDEGLREKMIAFQAELADAVVEACRPLAPAEPALDAVRSVGWPCSVSHATRWRCSS